MTANRIAVNTLSRIVRDSFRFGPRVEFLTKSAIQWLVLGKVCYVVNLSVKERACLEVLGFSLHIVLPNARGNKDLCEVTIR